MCSAIGVPVVLPSNTPERMRTWSGSWRWVVKREVPGRRLSRKGWISASLSASPGGQPSTTAPSAGPCDSPQVVKRKTRPKVLKDILPLSPLGERGGPIAKRWEGEGQRGPDHLRNSFKISHDLV